MCLTKRLFGSLENTNVLIIYMAKNLPKRIYTSIKLIKSINSRPEIKIDDGSQSQTKSSLMSSDSIIIKLFHTNKTSNKVEKKSTIVQNFTTFEYFQIFLDSLTIITDP